MYRSQLDLAVSVKPSTEYVIMNVDTLAQPGDPTDAFPSGGRGSASSHSRSPSSRPYSSCARRTLGSGTTLQGSGIAVRQVRRSPRSPPSTWPAATTSSIRVGRPRSVVVRADDNLIRHVTTRVDSGTLVIGSTGSYASKTAMSVTISVPALEALTLSGSGNVAAEDIHATRFTVSLSGSGNVHAGRQRSAPRRDARWLRPGQAARARGA